MASATSKPSKVTVSEKQGRASSKGVDNYYKTEVTTLGDGSIKRETFRTDAQGNNAVKVQEVIGDKDGKVTSSTRYHLMQQQEKERALNQIQTLN